MVEQRYLYHGIRLGSEKARATDIHYILDGLQGIKLNEKASHLIEPPLT